MNEDQEMKKMINGSNGSEIKKGDDKKRKKMMVIEMHARAKTGNGRLRKGGRAG